MSNIQHMIGLIASGLSVAALIIILMGFHILPIVVVVATLLPLSPPGGSAAKPRHPGFPSSELPALQPCRLPGRIVRAADSGENAVMLLSGNR